MTELALYSTLGCHLCEQALAIAEPLCTQRGHAIREIDIADDPSLVETYGIRIPVIRDLHSGEEIGWPFDADALCLWLERFT